MKLTGASAVREGGHSQLVALSGVVGTAVGPKRTAGRRSRTPSVVVFVRRKLRDEDLAPKDRIPPTLSFDGASLPTDVVEIGELEYQFGPPPWFCRDRLDNQGTVTTLCRSTDGQDAKALTCAHCMSGPDGDPSTADVVTLFDPSVNAYREIGASGISASNTGFGLPADFGFTDWGVFGVEGDPDLLIAAATAPPLLTKAPSAAAHLRATSAHGVLKGSIDHINAQIEASTGTLFADLIIRLDRGATYRGDSGLLWRGPDGRAVAIHAIGVKSPHGSSLSICMAAERIAGDLGVVGYELLDCGA